MSGIEAVRKIVETETQARKIVEDASKQAQQILSDARQQADKIRHEARARAEREAGEILSQARSAAESEARKSDLDTEQLLEQYKRMAEERKDVAIQKAVELILGA